MLSRQSRPDVVSGQILCFQIAPSHSSTTTMPAVATGKVLVSGANGYIAVWVVRSLLEAGFSVRGAVRSADKGAHLKQLFASYGEKFELVIVPDITKEGAFDEAVKGVDAVEHTASPFHMNADDPAELLEPAIKGTEGILYSIMKHAPTVRRVVVTSSVAAVLSMLDKPKVFDERDWNDQAVAEVAEKGKEANNGSKYRASKTLAERAAWKFMEEHKSQIGWDLVCLNPPLVLGPVIHAVSSPDALNTSALMMWEAFTKPGKAVGSGSFVDVRDLATAHVQALMNEPAGGERIIVCAGPFCWQDWLDVVPASNTNYEKGTPGAGKSFVHLIIFENGKAKKLLGLDYRTMEQTAKDTLEDYEQKGWIA
ncbi:D-lactaldehyde dehydrogenase [Mycena indigotica]|uniref:D-lactaldehyde dehydrogenase n=1 Tax=Mycena indigotica TaxID=2126181 RepID=A0A8H6SRH0_9AGAR|nr:D-lactaldehyde dehydrogenase [Mycena indigotica]KAF7304069.1 D-lactaldehyde dehydrogenase [Mycena indigotica]